MAYKYLNDNGLKAYTKKVKGALKDLHTPIAISTENTTESMAQNVRNIADFIAKAKAAGITDVKGMAVTCNISKGAEDGYSGVGYLHDLSGDISVQGVVIKDDLVDNVCFVVSNNGYYNVKGLIVSNYEYSLVYSTMLDTGARKPIILTPETTEVDEETYQKLLSDDVDVMFIASGGNLCGLTYKTENDDNFGLMFSCFSVEGETDADIYIYGYDVSITKNSPHTCFISEQLSLAFANFLNNSGYITQNALTPVLQEIDLTGTDAERKAKLDQFKIYWKALTGASDLSGARFVGKINPGAKCVFTFDPNNNAYWGLSAGSEDDDIVRKIYVDCVDGSLIITPLFSHLSPVKIIPDNFAASKQKNIDNLNAYKLDLADLGVELSNGYSVPVRITGNTQEYHGMLNIGTGALLSGIVTDTNENHYYPFNVNTTDGAITFDANNYFLEKTSNEVTEMLDAIKYSYTTVPLTATTSTNKTQLDSFISKVPNAQVMHVTYKDVYAGTLHKINGSWYGVLVGESNTIAGQLSIKLQADGTIVEGTA